MKCLFFTETKQQQPEFQAHATCFCSLQTTLFCHLAAIPSWLPILNTMLVSASLSWKVKIHKENLYIALQPSSESHSVHICKNNQSKVVSVPTLSAPSCSSIQDYISIVTWNCRSYHNSKHYLQDMIAKVQISLSYKSTGYGLMSCRPSALFILMSHTLQSRTSACILHAI